MKKRQRVSTIAGDTWAKALPIMLILTSSSCKADSLNDLVIQFTPACVDGSVQMRGTIANEGSVPISLEHGAMPWEFDPLATTFTAYANGKELSKRAFFPPADRLGPAVLAAGQVRTGMTPIEELFPELIVTLSKTPVTVRWKYPIKFREGKPTTVKEGRVLIEKNPCAS